MPLDTVPTYALYGETEEDWQAQWLHCESIAARSALFDWQIKPHRHHHFFQLLYIASGAAEVIIEGRAQRPVAPLAITVPPQAVHGFRFARDIQGHVITLPIGRVDRLLEATPEIRDIVVQPRIIELPRRSSDAADVDGQVAAVAKEYAGSGAWRSPLIEAHLTAALIVLARHVSAAAEARDASPANRRALEFRRLVDAHYRRRLPLAFYARKLGTSQTHLNRICRAAFQESALAFIDRRVILEATRDLTFSMFSVKEIASSLGFDDPAYFTRFFTKHVGTSPTEFRRRQMRAPAIR